LGGIAWLCAPCLVSFFIPNNPAVIAGGARFIRIMCLAWGGMGVQLCIVSAFRASGNMLGAMIVAMVSQWVIEFPMAHILAKHTQLGPGGLWWSFPMAVALVSVAWFARGSWKTVRLTEDDVEVAEVTREAVIEEGLR
jgi:Na+-driven multidrug efflux pump